MPTQTSLRPGHAQRGRGEGAWRGVAFPVGMGRDGRVGQDLNELFDVVDADDRVVGQAPRGEVHARGLRHRAVHIFVVNRGGEVFLHQRSLTKDSFPGLWNSSCAGHVGAGDDYDATAGRELEEELGCVPERAPARLFKVAACPETGAEFVWVYRVEAEGPFVLNPDEIQQGGWFAPAAIDRWVTERPREFATSFLFLWPQVRPHLTAAGRP